MATWKRLTEIEKSHKMSSNGNGTEIHFGSGHTLTVRESPEAVAT